MKMKKFQLTLSFLADILRQLARISKLLQEKNAGIADAFQAVEDLQAAVEKMKTKDGPRLQQKREIGSIGEHQLTEAEAERNALAFDDIKTQLLASLTSALECRFEDITNSILLAMRIANFSLWPAKDSAEWATYGDEQVQDIATHYKDVLASGGVDVDAVVEEWPAVRAEVGRRYVNPQVNGSWEDLHNIQDRFPNVLRMMDFILCLPSHSADCERGFSLMKRIKTDWRAKMNNDTLTNLMRVVLSTAEVENFDPEPALQHWLLSGESRRRPDTMPYGPREDVSDTDSE